MIVGGGGGHDYRGGGGTGTSCASTGTSTRESRLFWRKVDGGGRGRGGVMIAKGRGRFGQVLGHRISL